MNSTDFNPRSKSANDWISVQGKPDPKLGADLQARVESRISAGEYTWHNVAYVEKVSLAAVEDARNISDERLEKLRRVCQLWDVHLKGTEITSHRKFIGPIIVAFKKIFYKILAVLLKDFVRQQKSFNAGVVSLLAELSAEEKRK